MITFRALLPVFAAIALLPASAASPSFPIQPSADGRFLVDQNHQPFLWIADSAWTIVKKLTPDERDHYLDRRAAQGFTVVLFHAVSKEAGPATTVEGSAPFSPLDDISKPQADYWRRVEETVAACQQRGLVAAISALWLRWGGADQEGWRYDLTDERARGYGRFLGQRFRRYPNIVWILGGDANPRERAYALDELAQGIKTFAPQHPLTVHNAPEYSSAAFFHHQPWLDLNFAYTYRETYRQVFEEWHRPSPAKPIILGESGYELELNDQRPGTPHRIRRQAWGAILSGALGGVSYGHRDVWRFSSAWRQALDAPGAQHLAILRHTVSSLPWQRLVPDAEHNTTLESSPRKPGRDWEFVLSGGGSFGNDDYASSAFARDRSFALAYLPIARTIKVNLGRIAWGQTGKDVMAWWIDPTSGRRHLLPGSPFEYNTTQSWTPPATNSAGDPDWVLLVQVRDWRQDAAPKPQ
jgi:hypothetical protein